MNTLKITICFAALLFAATGLSPGRAMAGLVTGTNPYLPGGIYIPLKQETSGTLGQLVGGVGPPIIGKTQDTLTLVASMGGSTGDLEFMANFDLKEQLEQGPPLITSGTLTMTFDDFDFKVVNKATHDYREWMELEVYVGGSPVGTPLLIDNSNYWSLDYNG